LGAALIPPVLDLPYDWTIQSLTFGPMPPG
jgi:hypothetical protein